MFNIQHDQKNCMKFFLLFVLATVFTIPEIARAHPDIDSLLRVMETSGDDSVKVCAMNHAAFYYVFNAPEKAREMIDRGKELALRQRLLFGYNELLNTQGVYFDVLGVRDSAAVYFQEALRMSRKNGWPTIEEKALNNLGMNHWSGGNWREALDYFSQALALNASMQPENRINRAKYLNNIGLIYQETRRYAKALDFHRQALEIRMQFPLPHEQAISYANTALCYKGLGQHDAAIAHYEKAILLAGQANNLRMYYSLHDNLGNTYVDRGDHEAALPYFLKALERPAHLGQNPKSDLSVLSNLTATYTLMGQPKKALEYAQRGLNTLDAHPHLERFAPTLLKSTAQSHYLLGNWKAGHAYFDRFAAATDSAFSQENAEALASLEVAFETEKKEQHIALQSAELAAQRVRIQRNIVLSLALLALLVLAVALIFLVLSRNRRQATLMLREREILIKEAQIHAALASQESERKRLARDLHDGLGQWISALGLHIAQIEKETLPAARTQLCARASQTIDEMHIEIRNIAFNLMPTVLISSGLPAAIRELALRIRQAGGPLIQVGDFDMAERLSEQQEINLYRIMQEWLHNVLKYNSATRIDIQFVRHEHDLTIMIEDDGAGFDPTILTHSKGNGWKNIQSRLSLLKGDIALDTGPGLKGTTAVIVIPMQRAGKRGETYSHSPEAVSI